MRAPSRLTPDGSLKTSAPSKVSVPIAIAELESVPGAVSGFAHVNFRRSPRGMSALAGTAGAQPGSVIETFVTGRAFATLSLTTS